MLMVKTFFHISSQNSPSSILCLLPLILLLCLPSKSLALSSLTSPVRYLKTAIRSCVSFRDLAFLQGEEVLVLQPLLTGQVFHTLNIPPQWPSSKFTPVCQCPSFTREPKTGHSTPDFLTSAKQREELLLSACWLPFCLYSLGYWWPSAGSWSTLLAHDEFIVHQDPQHIFCKAALQLDRPACTDVWELYQIYLGT